MFCGFTNWKCWLQVQQSLTSLFCSERRRKVLARVPTKRKTWRVKAMWRVCAGNSRTDCLTGFLRESFCQPEFSSSSVAEVFSACHVFTWPPEHPAPPHELPCGLSHHIAFATTYSLYYICEEFSLPACIFRVITVNCFLLQFDFIQKSLWSESFNIRYLLISGPFWPNI